MHTVLQQSARTAPSLPAPPGALPVAQPDPAGTITVGWDDMAPHRSYLVSFARRKLMDPSLAEDLVHDVFEAVISGRAVFGGRSALRSWLVAILKHKIVDLVRQRVGHDSLDADDEYGEGLMLHCPQPQPDAVAEQRQRLRQTLARIAALPDTLREAVQLRLLHDQSSQQVCQALAITEQNLFVRLHRARRVLAS